MSKKIVSGAKYLIVAVHSGKLLRVKKDSDKDDAMIVQGHPMDRDIKTRQWKLQKLSNKMYKIKNVKTEKYLSVRTDSKENGVEMVQKKRDDSPLQQFKIVLTEKGDITIEIKDDEKRRRLEEEEREKELRKEKRDETHREDKNERDEHTELTKDRRSDHKEKRRVLDVEGASIKDEARIVQWKSNGEKNQRFRLIAVDTKSKL